MRTTVTLDPDVMALVQRVMRERDLTFKEALNIAVRAGLTAPVSHEPYAFPSYDMGVPAVSLEHALRLASEMEDEEITRELSVGR